MPVKLVNVADEYTKNPELKKDDVASLEEWVNKQPHLPSLSEFEIIMFLQSCRYSNEQAKSAIDNYYTMRTICPDFFLNRNPNDRDLKATLNATCDSILPQKTPEGFSVIIGKLIDTNPDVYVYPLQVRLFDMVLSAQLHRFGTMEGVRVILDMEGGTFSHLAKVSMSHAKKSMYYVQEAVPIRLMGIHFINVVSFMDKVLMLIKPFMKKELQDLLHVHSKIETLYEFIPQECLPRDYGGNADSIAELHAKSKKTLAECIDLFKHEESMLVDESKRPKDSKSEASSVFGASGTFKKIEVD